MSAKAETLLPGQALPQGSGTALLVAKRPAPPG